MNSDAIIFFAGMLTQAFALLIGRMTLKDAGVILLLCALASAGMIPWQHEEPFYDRHIHSLLAALIFTIGYVLCFKKKVLQRINKEILLVWTLVAVYTALKIPYIVSHGQLLFLFLMLSSLAVVNAFAGFDESYGWKIYFYIWFLIVIVGIIASQFTFSTVYSIFALGESHHAPQEIEPWNMFAIGMSFLYLAINAWCLIELVPIAGKHQSMEDRLNEIEDAMAILANEYDDEPVRRWRTTVLLVVCAGLLATNFFAQIVSDAVAISILIAVMPITDRLFSRENPVVASKPENSTPPAEYTPRRPEPPMPDEDILV